MHPLTRLVVVSVVFVALLGADQPCASATDQKCTGCHSTISPSSGYTLAMPRLSVSCPAVAPPDSTVVITIRVSHPGRYEFASPRTNLTLTGDDGAEILASESSALGPISTQGGISRAEWTVLTGPVSKKIFVTAMVDFTARHPHAADAPADNGRFALVARGEIWVRTAGVFVTEGELLFRGDERGATAFDIISSVNASNITVIASGDLGTALKLSPALITDIHPGQRRTIMLDILDPSAAVANGRIDVIWEDANGTRNATYVIVRIQGYHGPPAPAGAGPLRLMGRATGILLVGLLLASLALGLKKGGGKPRVRIHCAFSWFIIGLSVYHGMMLAWGPYSRIMWSNYLLLGYATAAVMGASGVNGVLQHPVIRRLGYKRWLWVHRVMIISAVVLLTIHAIALGTDTAFLRAPLGQ
jgi:hypothetical protein